MPLGYLFPHKKSSIQDKAQLSSSTGLDIAEKSEKIVFEFVHNLMFFLQTDALSWRLRGSCRSLGGLPGYNGSEAGTLKEAACIACLATLGSSLEGSLEAEGSHHLTYGRLFRGLERSLEAKEKSQGGY